MQILGAPTYFEVTLWASFTIWARVFVFLLVPEWLYNSKSTARACANLRAATDKENIKGTSEWTQHTTWSGINASSLPHTHFKVHLQSSFVHTPTQTPWDLCFRTLGWMNGSFPLRIWWYWRRRKLKTGPNGTTKPNTSWPAWAFASGLVTCGGSLTCVKIMEEVRQTPSCGVLFLSAANCNSLKPRTFSGQSQECDAWG